MEPKSDSVECVRKILVSVENILNNTRSGSVYLLTEGVDVRGGFAPIECPILPPLE